MTKEELKKYIESLMLEKELQSLLFELVDGAADVNEDLLNAIADILDQQADFYDGYADLLQREADAYGELAKELESLDEEEAVARIEAMTNTQEELLRDLQEKMEDVKTKYSTLDTKVTADSPNQEESVPPSTPTV